MKALFFYPLTAHTQSINLSPPYCRLRFSLLVAFLLLSSAGVWGQIVSWEMNGNVGNEVTVNATTNDSNLNTSALSRGSGLSASLLGNSFSSSNFTSSTEAGTVLNNEYIEFSISAKAGYKVSLSTLDANFRRSTTGPHAFRWQYQINSGGFVNINASAISYTDTLTNGTAQSQISLSAITDLQNVVSGDTINIRLYGWGASSSTGTFAIGRLAGNDLAIGGTVNSAGKTSVSSGDWNNGTTWSGGSVPSATDNVTIVEGTTVSMGVALTRTGTTTVNGSFQLNNGGSASGADFTYGTAGTLIFNSNTFYGVNSNHVFWPQNKGPVNVKVLQGGFNLNGGTSRIITGNLETAGGVGIAPGQNLTINGITTINTNGYFNSTPTYGSESTLVYKNQGGFNVGNEWNGNATTSGKGVPKDVNLISSILNFPNFDHGLAGNLNIDSNSTLNLNGTAGDLYLAGNWTKTGTFNPNNRAVFFNGGSVQAINGATTFDYLTLNNPSGVTLSNNVVNNFTLNLLNGKLILGANDLTIGSTGMISNATAAKYIVTNSTGQLKRTVGASDIFFPLGNSAYNPITFNNTGGISDVYGVRIADQTPAGANPTKTVSRRWITTEAAGGGSNLSVLAQYNSGETGVDFAAGVDSFIGFFNGTNYTQQVSATLAGSNPFAASSTTNLTPINLTSGTQYFAIGKDNAFVSVPSKLVFKSVPANGIVGTNLSAFIVEVHDVYNNVVKNFTGDIVIAKVTGSGIISGTLTKTAVAGVSTFNNIQFDAADTYTIRADSGNLTAAVSGNIVISPNPANAYFRSKTTGNWSMPGSWESSLNGSTGWETALVAPSFEANTISIKTGHTITIDTNVTVDQLIIENGGQLTVASDAAMVNINNGPGVDVDIQSGGIFQVLGTADYASTINFIGISTMNVHGKILVGNGAATNGSDYDKLATSSAAQIIWNDGAVFEWNSTGIFATSGKTFFPDINSAVIPIFRFSKGNAQAGGGLPTIINGIYEINKINSNWTGDSKKIFRNGIRSIGTGTMVNSGFGTWEIGDTTGNAVAELGGATGNLTLINANGISILPSCYATLTSNVSLGTNTKFTVSSGATLDFGFNGNTALNILGNSGGQTFTASAGSTLKITSPDGITKMAATGNVQSPTSSRFYDKGATYHYIGKVNQITGNGIPDQLMAKLVVELDTQNTTQDDLEFRSTGTTTFGTTGGVNGVLEIRKGKVFDEPGSGFRNYNGALEDGEDATQRGNIVMSGGRYVVSGSGTKPSLSGSYILNSGTIEFTGSAVTKIRTSTTPKQYFNVDVSGSNVESGGKNFIVNNLLKVTNTGIFTVPEEIDSANPYVITAKKGIQVAAGGKALFLNNANLIQDIDAANTGKINMQRKANVPSIQYNYWSSPVIGQPLYSLYDVPANSVMTYNSWNDRFTVLPSGSNPLSVFAKGYSIKGSATMNPGLTAEFVGVPNNENSGGQSITLSTLGNNYNLIGNPYPSNLDLLKLFTYNISKFYNEADEKPTAYFWDNTSNTDTSQQGPGYVNQNYAILNLSTGVGISAPRAGLSKKPNAIVKPGQGFIIRAAETGGDLIFKNDFRTTSVKVGSVDGVYYKEGYGTADKFWLILTTPNNINVETALAYNPEAENSFERFDSAIFSEAVSENFYSLSSDSKRLAIQTRKGDFDEDDIILLGVKTSKAGSQKISIEDKFGIFENHSVYLKDKYLNIITDLSAGAYEFTASSGVDDNRFEISYKTGTTLGAEEQSSGNIQVYRSGENFILRSRFGNITGVEVYDSSGRMYRKIHCNASTVILEGADISSGVYILKIKMTDGAVTKKIIK